jgi:hypothetical protein
MNRVRNRSQLNSASFGLLIALTSAFVASGLVAQEKKDVPATPAVKPATDTRAQLKAQPPAAGQIRSVAQPVDDFVGPPYQTGPNKAIPPAAIKAGAEIPKPTVVLKPGEVPGVRFDTPIYDFGRIRSGPDVEHDYWFTNTGTGPLEILRVKPSWGCTVAGQFDRIVQPGASGKIPIKISTAHGSGPVNKSIVVNTNIVGTDALVSLQLKGEIWQAIQATPTSAAFGRITSSEADKGAVRKITIVNNTEEPLKLSEPKSTNPKFSAAIAPTADGKKYELTITLIPPLVAGNNNGNIEIETGVKEVPKLTVPVYAYITAPVDVTPTALSVPPSRSATLTRQFYVRSNVDKAIKVTNLACTSPDITMDLADVKDAKTFRLTITVPATYKPRAGGDQITFNTDDPAVPLVTIPITETAPVRPMPPMAGKPGATSIQRPNGLKPANGPQRPTGTLKPVKAQGQNPAMNTTGVKPVEPSTADTPVKPEEKKAADQPATVKPTDAKQPEKPTSK